MSGEACPCGSGRIYDVCCGRLISGLEKASTAEQLMRSRYTAYVKEEVDYLVCTTHPRSRTPGLATSIRNWMDQVRWMRLLVLNADTSTVEFVAEYLAEGRPRQHRERSLFEKHKGDWFYVGEAVN